VAALMLAAVTFAAGWWLRPPPPLAGPPVVRELTFTGEDTQPDVSPDGRLIAFTSQRNGISQIWLRQVDGGGEQPLTEGPDWRPSFSPDSQSVAFIRADGDRYSAFRVPVVGGQPRKLIENVREVSWSPDERQLAFVRGSSGTDEDTAVGVLDSETGQERILATRGEWELFGLRWSADSRRLAMMKASVQGGAGNWKLMIIDTATDAVVEIDVGANSLISNPNWAGEDALIFAKSETTVTGTPRPSAIVRYELATGAERPLFWEPYLFPLRGSFTQTTRLSLLGNDRIVFDTLRQVQGLWELDRAAGTLRPIRQGVSMDRQPAYSPDGSRLVFTSNRSGNVDLFAYEFGTDRLLQITDHPASDWDGGYTPDGRSILFSSDRSGNLEIWIADADGSNPRQVTNTGVNAENPTMTADGEWIVYSSGDPADPGIYKIRPDGTDATLLVVGALSNPEVSHDGRYALYVAGDEAKQRTQLRVVEVTTGEVTGFVSETAWEPGSANVTYNRARWMAGDEAVAFLGIDERGRPAIWVQDFDPDRDTNATRRKLTDVEIAGVTESFGISPDGNRAVIAVVRNLNILKMAENLGPLR
jgi:Tol biopolymer transport system component